VTDYQSGHRCQTEQAQKLRDQGGTALIVTLLIVALLSGLVVDFAYEVYIDTATLSNWGNAQRASFLARSGQVYSTELIKEASREAYTDIAVAELPVPVDFEQGVSLTIRVADENAKFNMNSIIFPNGKTDEKALSSLQNLLEYLNINPNLAQAIADWIDPDSEPRLFDTEDLAKNGPLWSLKELTLIKGIDREVFDALSPYITVFGNGRININTADLAVLVSISSDITEEMARQIIDYRESAPFETTSAIVNVSSMETVGIKILDRITVKASSFRITSEARVDEIVRIIESVMDSSNTIYFWREA
jgi:general secretion pathway protein K